LVHRSISADQSGRRLTLVGTIDEKPGILLVERAPLPATEEAIKSFQTSLTNVKNTQANDIYAWYLANVKVTEDGHPDIKLNLIYPCTEKHIKKYLPQTARMVTETPEIYARHVRPHMIRNHAEGRLNWVFNIIEGRKEQEDIIIRSTKDFGKDEEGFLLLPDMNWDRLTTSSLRILGLVERRDLMSIRDLKKKHVPWLKRMFANIVHAVAEKYEDVEADMLKCYMHCKSLFLLDHLANLQLTLLQINPPTTTFTSTSSR
jgi:m7GpppX diphosphatase